MLSQITDKKTQQELMERFFWFIGDGYFLDALHAYKKGEGFGIESIACLFHDEFQPWEETYFGNSGVAYIEEQDPYEESLMFVMNYQEFYRHLQQNSDKYLIKFPQKKIEVEECLNAYREKFNINDLSKE
ncbi:ribonuclease toxin immunity protein CdiI [Paenibacillus wulumuqiensis]|uniref:ribonuclease toxin immunity protein CdiI n=1 Tax=Paenibacillus wulumuqiensis TaxID=1567107 RepID=UPI0006192421|nr:ribonuclease toxin immunity protein CdiI [Paenibacillus wulumuqiensis]